MTTLQEAFNSVCDLHKVATEKNDMPGVIEAGRLYKELLNQAPDEVGLLFGLGTTEMQQGYNGAAITWFQKALTFAQLPEIWNNLGTAYKAENRDEEARECWERAIALRDDPDYYNNMATLYVNVGNPSEGLEWAERGIKIAPDHARLHWNYSLLLLEQGRWREGFREYEWGLKSNDRPVRDYGLPFWDGTPGKRVIVYGEQGVGDEIMYASAIPDLMRDCEVVFDCHPRMVNLFRRSFGIECRGTRKEADDPWHSPMDAKLAIASLFGFYRNEGVFPKVPYLKADPELVAHYRQRLADLGDGPYVGIGWKAGTKSTRADLRSFKLAAFNDIIDCGGTFVSLQYTSDSAGKAQRYREQTGRVIHHWPEVVETGPDNSYTGFDYDHTVALIEALDLCILPNTTAVHVCGALGKECWTMTPQGAAWRYQLSGDQMPMYASVRQFRGELEGLTKAYRDRWARPEPARAAGR